MSRLERRRHGLKGNSGFMSNGMHIAAPYGTAPDEVFVNIFRGRELVWRRCTRKQAKAWGKKPIPCCLCKRPAVRLDHHYPYYASMNRCAQHLGAKVRDE